MSFETGVVVGRDGEPIYWHVPPGRTSGSLPDSRDLWDVIWENRDRVEGIAHTHPGRGEPGPSHTDVTTFDAVELGLGRPLSWWIASEDSLILVRRDQGKWIYWPLQEEPGWLSRLRELSYGRSDSEPRSVAGEP